MVRRKEVEYEHVVTRSDGTSATVVTLTPTYKDVPLPPDPFSAHAQAGKLGNRLDAERADRVIAIHMVKKGDGRYEHTVAFDPGLVADWIPPAFVPADPAPEVNLRGEVDRQDRAPPAFVPADPAPEGSR